MIGVRLREARSAKKLSLREVGEAMGVSPQAVAQWERGKPRFSVDKLYLLANLLDVSADWLRGRVGTDDVVQKSEMFNTLNGRVPIINIHHSILIAPFARTNFEDIPYKETIEPSARILGQGYAIRMRTKQEELGIDPGDIIVFDNNITATHCKIILGIEIFENTIRSVIAGVMDEKELSNLRERVKTGHNDEIKSDEYDEYTSMTGSIRPIAVAVEHRRLFQRRASDSEV